MVKHRLSLPSQEIVGRVRQVGSGVSNYKQGNLVGIGCLIDSCKQRPPCKAADEYYCERPNSFLATYNGPMTLAKMAPAKLLCATCVPTPRLAND